MLPAPSPDNDYHAVHVALLLDSYRKLTSHDLIPAGTTPIETAKQLYEAPIFVASHNTANDPVLTYGNSTAQALFEMSWEQFTQTASRFTAEEPNRAERARLLAQVTNHGFIDDYSGIRISSTGQRFRIDQATVWNLLDNDCKIIGQASTFSQWQLI